MTSHDTIARWLQEGRTIGATHMIVICDTFDHDDFPVYVMPGQNSRTIGELEETKPMQRIMEVYDLAIDDASQLTPRRVFNW